MKKQMKKIVKKFLSIALAIAIAVTCVPTTTYAEEISNERAISIETETFVSIPKTDINFIVGTPGDEYLVYTYIQNGHHYKVVEYASDDFRNISSTIYVANDNGQFIELETQQLETIEGQVPTITIEKENGLVESFSVNCDDSTDSKSDETMPLSDYEWVTEYYSGKSSSIKGLTISVIIGVITGIASYYCAGPVASGAVSGVSAIASYYFQEDSEYAYYYTIYNWRHSSKSYFVIEETEWTDFYLDSGHKYKVGHTYYEWLDE